MTESDDWLIQSSKALANAIDQEIIEDIKRQYIMLKGWVKAPVTTDQYIWPYEHRLDEVVAWIHVNHSDEYQIFGKEFWFKSKQDLTAFILRWS